MSVVSVASTLLSSVTVVVVHRQSVGTERAPSDSRDFQRLELNVLSPRQGVYAPISRLHADLFDSLLRLSLPVLLT